MSEEAEAATLAGVDQRWVDEVVARTVANIAPDDITMAEPEQRLVADLGYHSILLIELAFALEELFELDQVSLDDPPPTGAVKQLQEYVLSKVLAGQAVAPTAAAVDEFFQLR